MILYVIRMLCYETNPTGSGKVKILGNSIKKMYQNYKNIKKLSSGNHCFFKTWIKKLIKKKSYFWNEEKLGKGIFFMKRIRGFGPRSKGTEQKNNITQFLEIWVMVLWVLESDFSQILRTLYRLNQKNLAVCMVLVQN